MYADVAELVDALASGASASNGVKVQVLSSAPKLRFIAITQAQCVCFFYILAFVADKVPTRIL